jgi:formate hydrogenlyase subunit 4
MTGGGFLQLGLASVLAPATLGVIQRIKSYFAGRMGAPLVQPYRDLLKLARKDVVLSRTTTWVFRAMPIASASAPLAALAFLPLGGSGAVLAFPGDLVVVVLLLAVARFFTLAAALDTGSSFAGMGASREAAFSALAEPALFLALVALCRATGSVSLTPMIRDLTPATWAHAGPALVLVAASLLAVLLAECGRIPVDDPATHLELTMIHEAMVLDHSGPDLALVLYGAAVRFWVLASLLVSILVPVRSVRLVPEVLAFLFGMLVVSVLVGVIEAAMARLRLFRVPQFLVGAAASAALALLLLAR